MSNCITWNGTNIGSVSPSLDCTGYTNWIDSYPDWFKKLEDPPEVINYTYATTDIILKPKYTSEQYTPRKIIFNGPVTIVFWNDDTKTVVRCAKGDKNNPYAAFCSALAKKIFETNGAIKRIVDSGIDVSKKNKAKKKQR